MRRYTDLRLGIHTDSYGCFGVDAAAPVIQDAAGPNERTPNIAPVIQEIVDRPVGKRQRPSRDHHRHSERVCLQLDPNKAPLLYIG